MAFFKNAETEALYLYFGNKLKDINTEDEARAFVHNWIDEKEKGHSQLYIKLLCKKLRSEVDELIDYKRLTK